jgi:anti-sigma regulatory factor (Ser/Thr protein kinase)
MAVGPQAATGSLSPSVGKAATAPPGSCRRSYPGRPDQAAGVRAFLAGVLAGCPAAADVVLMADELVSNAVQHSDSREPGGTFGVRLEVRSGESVQVEVADAGGRWASPGPGCDTATDGYQSGGRGLHIVGALAATWGVRGDETGRTVWFVADWDAR